MKKEMKLMCAAAALTLCMSYPAFAAETKAEYREETSSIRSEMQAIENEMKPFREENKSVAARYKSIRLEKKNNDTLSVSKENWKKAKELHKEIVSIRKSADSPTVKSLKMEAKAAVKNKNFDSAAQSMERALESKKDRYDSLKEINSIWERIDDLLQ